MPPVFQKKMEIVRLLIEYKFDVNAVGPQNGYTPLHIVNLGR